MFFSKNIIMNQILENQKIKKLNKKIYLIQFLIIFFIISCLIIYFLYQKYSSINTKKISQATHKGYLLSRLYSTNVNTTIKSNNSNTSIIGNIEIPKLKISYPIFSKCSDELLKISVCKFYGSELNLPGNLCIAGHNYDNGDFFSNLSLLKIQDVINIYDTNNIKTSYIIYNIYEVFPTDMHYLSQETNRSSRNNSCYL